MFQTNAGHICVPFGNIHITDSQQCLGLDLVMGWGDLLEAHSWEGTLPCQCLLTLRRVLSVVNVKGFPVGFAEGLETRSFQTLVGKIHDHFLQVTEGEPDLNQVPKGLKSQCGIVSKELSKAPVPLNGAAAGWQLVAQDHHGLKLGILQGLEELSVALHCILVWILGASCWEKLCPRQKYFVMGNLAGPKTAEVLRQVGGQWLLADIDVGVTGYQIRALISRWMVQSTH